MIIIALVPAWFFFGSRVPDNLIIRTESNTTQPEVIIQPEISKSADGHLIKLYEDPLWVVQRDHPSGYQKIILKENEESKSEYKTVDGWKQNALPVLVLKSPNKELYFVVYDVEKNSPSGKRLDKVYNAFDLYVANPKDKEGLKVVANNIELGGLDTVVYGNVNNGYVNLCGDNRCVSINNSGETTKWKLDSIQKYEFVEVKFQAKKAVALLRKKHDDRTDGKITEDNAYYYIASFDVGGVTSLDKIEGLPWGLKFVNGIASYKLAKSADDLKNIFYFDFNRMLHNGVNDYGANNLDGRIAWSSIYYLNGLITLLTGKVPNIAYNVEDIKKRLQSEIKLIVDACTVDYPGFRVKRYSLDREPQLFALHIGRVSSLINRAKEHVDPDVRIGKCGKHLEGIMSRLDITVH